MKEIPKVFYYYIHSKIWEWAKGKPIQKKMLKGYLAEWRIPTNLRPLIIKELIIMGLIKKYKRHLVEINKPLFDEERINDLYIELNIF